MLRTRLREAPQSDGLRKYTGLRQALGLIAREEGIRGFYKGLLPHIIRVVPNSAIIFLTYELGVHVRRGMNVGGVRLAHRGVGSLWIRPTRPR